MKENKLFVVVHTTATNEMDERKELLGVVGGGESGVLKRLGAEISKETRDKAEAAKSYIESVD